MALLLTMPALSPTMETGVISTWNKKVGDKVEPGDLLAEVETDKAVMEWEAADEGVLREILVQPGQELSVGMPVAILGADAKEDISALLAQAKSVKAAAPAAKPVAKPSETAPKAVPVLVPMPAPHAASAVAAMAAARAPGERIKISPYARKLANERHLEVASLAGSGPSGRIVARDVQAAIASGGARPVMQPGLAVVASGEAYEDLPISMMRKAIARKMEESKRTVPHFQATRKIRMDRVVTMREQLKTDFPDIKISINDLIVKAVAVALRFHPMVNSQYLGDRIRRFHTIDVCVAVATEDGLITPIVRGADRKTVSQIAREVRELAERARAKKLQPEEYTGGTFTISNLGMYGIDEFNGIINTPQACLLAVSAVVREPVVEGGGIVPAHTMNVTLSSDHRVVDGATAAEFLRTLTRILENPLALVM
jgi:pyruvate dehydrogenase E2 component (dihydrolipoamide acetyltransferase)